MTENNNSQQASPSMVILNMISGTWVAQLVYAAAKLGIADLLSEGPQNIDSLSQSTGTKPSHLYRVLRGLAGYGIFQETEPKTFSLTPLAEPLRSNVKGSMRNLAITCGDDYYFRPFGHILYTLQTGKSAFHKAHGKGIFEYLTENKEDNDIFSHAMTDYISEMHISFAEHYDFSGAKKVVDVGGGYGTLMMSILKKNPHLKGVIFDRPSVIEGSRKNIAEAGLAERCDFVGGNFFEKIAEGGDIYIFSSILHGWNNEEGSHILRNCHNAMVENGKLLLGELVIPPGNQPHFGKIHDINLMVAADSGQERDEEDFRDLYECSGFKLTRIIATNSPGSIVEGVRV